MLAPSSLASDNSIVASRFRRHARGVAEFPVEADTAQEDGLVVQIDIFAFT